MLEQLLFSPELPNVLAYAPTDAPIDEKPLPPGLPPAYRALLRTIMGSESNYPGKDPYKVMYGGREVSDFGDHPRTMHPIVSGPNKGNVTSAAGGYQFLGRSWDESKNALGLKDFSPESQDKAAIWHAENTYKRATKGGDLRADIEAAGGDPAKLNAIGSKLSGWWTSLPGGIEPNPATRSFGDRFAKELAGPYRAGPALYNGDVTQAPTSPITQASAAPNAPSRNAPMNLMQYVTGQGGGEAEGGGFNPLLMMLGLQLAANSQLSDRPNNLFAGMPGVIATAQAMQSRDADRRENRALRQQEFAFRQSQAERDQANIDRQFRQSQITPAQKAAEDYLGPNVDKSSQQYKDFMTDYYKLPGQGFTPVKITRPDGTEETVFQDKRGGFKTLQEIMPSLVRPTTSAPPADPNNPTTMRPPPPGVDPKKWRELETKRINELGESKPLPVEAAGRVALAETYLSKADKIEKQIREGGVTGWFDLTKAKTGRGTQGEIYGDIKSGSDSIRRMLSGAGIPEKEAGDYVQRYEPSYFDDADSMLIKHNRLKKELEVMVSNVRQGRGPIPPDHPLYRFLSNKPNDNSSPGTASPDAKKRLRFNPSTGLIE